LSVTRRCVRWFTNLCLVDSQDKETGELLFDPEVGCNQGGEGCVRFAQWWIENVMEELGTHLQQHRSSRHLHFAGLDIPLFDGLSATDRCSGGMVLQRDGEEAL